MRKLIESLVSLDGVTEAPERWANFADEDVALSMEQLGNYDAFVMGRVTYENSFANWGHVTAPRAVGGDPTRIRRAQHSCEQTRSDQQQPRRRFRHPPQQHGGTDRRDGSRPLGATRRKLN